MMQKKPLIDAVCRRLLEEGKQRRRGITTALIASQWHQKYWNELSESGADTVSSETETDAEERETGRSGGQLRVVGRYASSMCYYVRSSQNGDGNRPPVESEGSSGQQATSQCVISLSPSTKLAAHPVTLPGTAPARQRRLISSH